MKRKCERFLTKMKSIQENILIFIDEQHDKNNLQEIIEIFKKYKLQSNRYRLYELLYLIIKIANDHHQTSDFYLKIEEILKYLAKRVTKYFSNSEIFHIFKGNKRILLFLIDEKILNMDKYIANEMLKSKYIKMKYTEYFLPEIRDFIDENVIEIIPEKIDNFYENRKIGQNDNYLCKLIRNDSVDEFIIYVNQKNINLDITIKPSIFETNNFLLKNEPSLIEYAAFYGSIQIFQYLTLNNVNLSSKLWLYAIHSNNAEMIHLIESNHIDINGYTYDDFLKEAIKCHHNEIKNYIQTQYFETSASNDFIQCLHYYNFILLEDMKISQLLFIYMCKYDHCYLVHSLINSKMIKVNSSITYSKKIHPSAKYNKIFIINCQMMFYIHLFKYNS